MEGSCLWTRARHLIIHSFHSLKASTGLGKFTFSSRRCPGVTWGVSADSSSIHLTSALEGRKEVSIWTKHSKNSFRKRGTLASKSGSLNQWLRCPRKASHLIEMIMSMKKARMLTHWVKEHIPKHANYDRKLQSQACVGEKIKGNHANPHRFLGWENYYNYSFLNLPNVPQGTQLLFIWCDCVCIWKWAHM